MNNHFWQGRLITDSELRIQISNLNDFILEAHKIHFHIDEFFRACDRFSKRLSKNSSLRLDFTALLVNSGECNLVDAEIAIDEIKCFLDEKAFRAKVKSEFGTDNPFRSTKVSKSSPIFESWFPLGFLVQILASNSPSLAVLSAFEGLVTGNINFIKLSKQSSDFTIQFFKEFFEDPVATKWKDLLIVAKVSSREKALLSAVMSEADGIVAWGGEESLAEIRKLTPTRARLIEWGHRISFAYVTQKKLSDQSIFNEITKDVFLFDQQACSSPQCLYLENASFSQLKEFAESLKAAFIRRALSEKMNQPSDLDAAEITRTVLLIEAEKALHVDFADAIEPSNRSWRILIDSRQGLRASPLYRTLWIKPLKRDSILSVLRPLGQYLQTVGLSCERDEVYELMQSFYKAGVTRIRPLGNMLGSYPGEPHDGVSALTRYMKKVSLEQNAQLEQFATLDDLRLNKIELVHFPTKIMTKEDFQAMRPADEVKELFFKSGGSSGEPKISVFTYHDYHRQMRYAADGLLAAGLNPAIDKCINLFFSGGLYGSFLSIFSVLEDLEAIQLPMAAHMDFDFVADIIVTNKVNVLMGMPSYLMQLLETKKQVFKKHSVIRKIYFGGETFTAKQIEHLKSEFQISVIISATYGSVDMGPLGYQCEQSPIGIHHLHQSLHHLEILDFEKDTPASDGHPGRLVFTSYGRQGLTLERYDVGDFGRWVTEPCLCGRLSPRFELLGRQGDAFRAAGMFLNYNKFAKILSGHSYNQEFQLVMENPNLKDSLSLYLDLSNTQHLSSNEIYNNLLNEYKDLCEIVKLEKNLIFRIIEMDNAKLLRSPGSGKLLRVIDRRKQK